MGKVSRKISTYQNLLFQYLMMVVMIVRGIIVPPVAAQHIDHDVLGAWFASGNIVQWLLISEGGAWLYLRQKTAQEFGKNNTHGLAAAIGAGGVFLFVLGFIIVAIGLSIAPMIPVWMHVDTQYSEQLILAFSLTTIGFALGLPAAVPRAIAHGLQRQLVVNSNLLVSEIISVTVTIVLIFKNYGIIALGVAPLVREIIQNLLNWPLCIVTLKKLQIKPVVSLMNFKDTSVQMGWTFVNNLSNVLRNNVDAIIVSQLFGNSSVLIVEWTKRGWDIFYALVTRATGSFTPALAHLYGEGDNNKFCNIISKLFSVMTIALGVTLAFGLAFNHNFVGIWVGEKFFAGDKYNLLLGLSVIVTAISFTLVEILFATGNIRGPAIAQLIKSVVRLGILFTLVPHLGILSIPSSVLVSELIFGVIYLSMQWKKTLGVPYKDIVSLYKSMFRMIIFAAVLAGGWMLLPKTTNSWESIILQGILFGVVMAFLMYLFEPVVKTYVQKFKVSIRKQIL